MLLYFKVLEKSNVLEHIIGTRYGTTLPLEGVMSVFRSSQIE